jgi:hypothetical protein
MILPIETKGRFFAVSSHPQCDSASDDAGARAADLDAERLGAEGLMPGLAALLRAGTL